MKCLQCNCAISDSLSESITQQQLKVATDPENAKLICISCFCQNNMAFECPERLKTIPLSKAEVEELNEEKEQKRKERRIERKRKVINTGSGNIPSGDRRSVARWDISKHGRIGKPVGIKNDEGHNCWACPICGTPCERKFNFPGRSLDDVVHHMIEDGCYDKFEAEESV